MSTTTDSRVVELRFDNKEFEANAQTTINTLSRLKQALDSEIDGSAFDNLDRAARNVDLSGIQAGIETLTDRFSTMGIVGMTVIQNITSALTNTLGKAVSSAMESITGGGVRRALNIENARFQLQGILDDGRKVAKVMKNASDSVDGTAYALDEAAKAASQLAASGVEAGDQMTSTLRGIAGVAATANADYESIAHIFTTAAGQSKIMTEQLRQLENRGLNAAATLADYFNTVIKTGEGASDTVKDLIGQITGNDSLRTSISDTAEATKEAAQEALEAQQKAFNKEYKLRQKEYNKQYKLLQKSLNEQYNAKKKELDAAYNDLAKSLDAEIQAQQKANSQKLKEAQNTYKAQVQAYKEATTARIALINKEYTESIKLIDEERYNKIKAVQDQIDAINKQAEAEKKAKQDAANESKRAEIQQIIDSAKNSRTRRQAEEVLAEFEAELAEQKAEEERKAQIEALNDEIDNINEKADAEIAAEKEKASEQIENIQNESDERLEAMAEAYSKEIEALQEANSKQIEEMREARNAKLSELKEGQSLELAAIKESQNEQLEVYRENQQQQLEDLKESQNEQLKVFKQAVKEAKSSVGDYTGLMEVTEADIRNMVTDGLISFDLFSEAMSQTFGEHAYDANKTFQGAMSNIRAALARTGAMFVTPLVQQEGPLVNLLNTIRVKINEFNKALNPVAHYITELINSWLPVIGEKIEGISFRAKDFYHVWRGIYAVGEFIFSIFKAIGDGFKEAFDVDTTNVKDAAKSFQLFAESLKLTNNNASNISKIVKAIVKVFKALWSITKRLLSAFTPLGKLFGATSDDLLDLNGNLADVIIRFADWLETSQRVESFFTGLKKVMSTFVDVIIKVKDRIKELTITSDAFNIGKNFIQGFIEGVKSVVATVYDYVFGFCSLVLGKIREIFQIDSPSKVMFQYGVYIIQGLINGIKSLAENAGRIIVDVFETILKTVKEKFSNITDTIKELASGINSKSVNMNGEEIGSSFISEFIKGIISHIPNPIVAIKEFFGKIKESLLNPNIGTPVGNGFMSGFLEGVKEAAKKIVEKIKTAFSKISDKITGLFNSSSDSNGEESGENFILSFLKGLKEAIGDKSGNILESIGSAFEKIKNNLPSLQVIGIAAGSLAGLILLIKSVKSGFLANIIKPFTKLSKIFKIINFAKKKDQIADFISGLTQSGNNIAGNLNDGFVAGIKDKFKGAIDAAKKFASNVLQAIKDVFGIASPSKEMISIATNLIETFVDTIVTYSRIAWEKITEVFSGLLDKIKELFTKGFAIIEEHGPQLISLATGLGVLLLIVKITRQMDKIVLPFKSVNKVLKSFSKVLKDIAWDLKATAILKFASAFSLLVVALTGLIWVSQQVDDVDTMVKVIAGFITLLLAFAGSTYLVLTALEKLSKAKYSIFGDDPKNNALIVLAQGVKSAIKEWAFGNMVKNFAKSVAIIVASIFALVEIIKNNELSDVQYAVHILAGIAAFMLMLSVIFAFIASQTTEQTNSLNIINNQFTQVALGFLAFAVTFYLIVKTIEKVINLTPNNIFEEYGDKLKLLAIIFGAMAALVIVLAILNKKIKGEGGGLSVTASPIIAFTALLLVAIWGLKKCLDIDLNGEDTLDKLKIFRNIFIAVGILSIILTAISAKAQGSLHAGGTIIALCFFLLTAAGAVAILGNFKPVTLIKGIISIILIMIACAIAVNAASGVEPASFKVILSLIVMLAACVALIGGITFVDTKKLLPAVAIVCGVLLVIAFVFSQLAKVNSKEGSGKVIAMVVALGVIAGGLWLVSQHPWERILLAGIAIAGVLLTYAKIFKSIAKTKVNQKSVGAFVIGSISIAIIGGILTALATQDWGSILSAGFAISAVLYTYGKVFQEISKVEANPTATLNFIVGAVSIAVIGGILTALATQDWGSILSAGVSIALVLEAYADVFQKISNVKITSGEVINFVIGSVAVAIIGGILTAVATQDWSSILSAGTAISGVLLAYKKVFTDLQGVEVSLKTVGNFLIGAIAIAIIGRILYGVSQNDWSSILSAGGSISLVLEAMADAIKIINGIEISWSGFGALVGGLVAVAAVGYILHQASTDTNWADMLGTAISIITVLIGLCIVLGILSLVGNLAPQAGVGILLLDGLIADLAAVLVALGALTEYTAFKDLVKSGQSTLILLGESLGNFVGAIVEGLIEYVGLGIEKFGTSLSNFMTNAKPFFDGLKEIDDNMVKSAQSLVQLMLAFAVAELIESWSTITNIFGFFTPSFSEKFGELGKAISTFAKNTKGINGWNVKNIAEAIQILISVGNDVGILNSIESYLLPAYADHLAQFAKKMPSIVSNMGDTDKVTYENVAGAMAVIINVMDNIKSIDFRDAESLPEFGQHIADFSSHMKLIAKRSANVNPTDFENLYNASKWVIDIAKLVPYQQGSLTLLGMIGGSNDIQEFGRKVHSFAKRMGGEDGIATYAKDMDPAIFENLYNSSAWVLKIAEAVPYTKSGLSAIFSGNNDIAKFGSKLASFTRSMASIQEYLSTHELNSTDFYKLKNITVVLLGIVEKLKELNEDKGLFKNDFNAGTAIKQLGEALKGFGKNIKECGTKAMEGYIGFSGAIELLEKLQKMMPDLSSFTGESITTFLKNLKQYGIDGLKNFLDSFTNSEQAVSKAISTMFGYISSTFTSKKDLTNSLGRITIGYLTTGMTEARSIVENAAKQVCQVFRSTISQSGDFKQAGRDAGRGFAQGLRDTIDEAKQAGGSLGRAAYIAARKALDEHSPSRKMAEVGSFAGEGFVQGFIDWLSAASEAGKDIGDSAREGLNAAIEKISKEIQNEDDFNPVITPILDLSNIEDNASAINGLLNLDKPIALAANAGMSFTGGLNSLLGNIQASIPDNSNDDVVASINGLREDVNILNDRIAKIQVVMDTGELVGVLTDPIDQQLGFNSILNARGVR